VQFSAQAHVKSTLVLDSGAVVKVGASLPSEGQVLAFSTAGAPSFSTPVHFEAFALATSRVEQRGVQVPTTYLNGTVPRFLTATPSTAYADAVNIVRTNSTSTFVFVDYGSYNVSSAWWAGAFHYPSLTLSKTRLDAMLAMGFTEVGFAFDAHNGKSCRIGFSLVSVAPQAGSSGQASNAPPGTDAPGIYCQLSHGSFRWRRGVLVNANGTYGLIADTEYTTLALDTTLQCELMISTTSPYHLTFRHTGASNNITEYKTSDSTNTEASVTGGLAGSQCFGGNWNSNPSEAICLDATLMTNSYALNNLRFITSRL
jgi:hypothetical protein